MRSCPQFTSSHDKCAIAYREEAQNTIVRRLFEPSRTCRRSNRTCGFPLPIRHRLKLIHIRLIRIVNHKVKESRTVLYALNFMHHFNQKRDVVNSQVPPEMIPYHFQADGAIKIALAYILAARIRRPHASPRGWRLVEKAVLAVEEELGETWSRDCRSVVVAEAEGVRVARSCIWESIGGCHVFRCVLAVVQVSRRIVHSRCVLPGVAYGPLIGTIWDPSPETQYHILSLELTAESVKLESEEARVTNMVDPSESK